MDVTELDKLWSIAVDAVAADLIVERWRIEEALAYGGCGALALALNARLDLPIFIAATHNNYAHSFCAVSGDRGLDIWGVRPFRTILAVWSEDDPDVELLRVSSDDLRSMGGIRLEKRFERVPDMLAARLAEALLEPTAPGRFSV